MPTTYVLGMNAKIYHGDAGDDTPSAMTELDNVRNVTLTMEAGEADITARANSGWRATAPTLKTCTVEFEMVWKPGDAGFDAVKAAFLANTTLALAVLDGDEATVGTQGPIGDFGITNFSRNEQLEEAITVSVTAKLAVYTDWYTKAGA